MNTYCTYIYSYKYTNPFAYKQLLNIPFFLRNIPAKDTELRGGRGVGVLGRRQPLPKQGRGSWRWYL